MGGVYGINRFQPDDIKYNKVFPKVLFTHIFLFNDEVKVGKKYGDRVILEKALNQLERVDLNYEQNIFSVQFASDNYILPEKVKYIYRLEGFSDEWMATEEGKVTYTNLSPGTYVLKVKAINGDGYSGDEEAALEIVVHPPFWLSIWAYMIYVVLSVLVVLWVRYYIRRSIARNQLNEQPKEPLETTVVEDEKPIDNNSNEEEEEEGGLPVELIEENGILMLRAYKEAEDQRKQENMEAGSATGDSDFIENVETISTIAPQRAMIIQLTEEDDRIVTHILPPEELPDMASTVGFRKNLSSRTPSVKRMMDGNTLDDFESESNVTAVTADERLINQAVKYVEDNMSRSDFSVEELSRHLGMSRVNLYKKLLAITGKTPIEFIRVIRLKRAAQLLRTSRQGVSEIGFQVGFNNPKYFSKYFKEEFGMLPSAYQEKEGK